jgi:hypothetical protein
MFGGGAVRFLNVYKLRRCASLPVSGVYEPVAPESSHSPGGCQGFTLAPPSFSDNSPDAASAQSRSISALSRNEGPRESSAFAGSFSSFSLVAVEA